jgi:hypothetical protein
MAQAHVEGEIAAPVAEVWKVVGDFAEFLRVQNLPTAVEGEGVGMTRKVQMGPDVTLIERLEAHDDATYTTKYSMVEGPLPVTDYLSTIRLTPSGDDKTTLIWETTFQPAGIEEDKGVSMLEGGYAAGIKALQKHFSS